jgi:hypothetical protein
MEIEEEKVLYPNTNEQDMYIRSLPMEQPQQEYSPSSELNDTADLSANIQPYEFQPFDMNNKTGIIGYKNHYNMIPDIITNDIFTPHVQTTINFGNTQDNVVYKPSQEPSKNIAANAKEEKEDQMTENSRQSPAKKSAIHKDVLDLLVSDLSGLSIDKNADQTDQTNQTEQLKKHQRLLKQLGEAINKTYSKESTR